MMKNSEREELFRAFMTEACKLVYCRFKESGLSLKTVSNSVGLCDRKIRDIHRIAKGEDLPLPKVLTVLFLLSFYTELKTGDDLPKLKRHLFRLFIRLMQECD